VSRVAAAALVVAACKPLPPAPMVALHDSTAAAPVDTTTALVVVGLAGEVFGGDGLGVGFRLERQVTARTALGAELVVGRQTGDRDQDDPPRLWLVAARGYGQGTPRRHDWFAITYGAGVGWLSTGLVSLNAFAGAAVSVPNDYAVPYLQVGVAPVAVVRRGRPFGSGDPVPMCWACEDHLRPTSDPAPAPRSDVFWVIDLGVVGVVGDTGNRVSVDLGMAGAMRAGEGLISISAADAQRLAP